MKNETNLDRGLHGEQNGQLLNNYFKVDEFENLLSSVQIKEGRLGRIRYTVSQLYLSSLNKIYNRVALYPEESRYVSYFEIGQEIKGSSTKSSIRIYLKQEKQGINVNYPFANILLPVFERRENETWKDAKEMYLEYDFDLRKFRLGRKHGILGVDSFLSKGTASLDDLIILGLEEIPIQLDFDRRSFTLGLVDDNSLIQVRGSWLDNLSDFKERIINKQLMVPIKINMIDTEQFGDKLNYNLVLLTGLPLFRFMMRQHYQDGRIYSLGEPSNNETNIRLSLDGSPYLWNENEWKKASKQHIRSWVKKVLNELRFKPELHKPSKEELRKNIDSSFLVFSYY